MPQNQKSVSSTQHGSTAVSLPAPDAHHHGTTVLTSDHCPTGSNSESGLRNREIVRKFLHMLPGLLPFVFPFMEHPDPLDGEALQFVTIVTVVLTLTFLACFRIVRRPGEDNLISTVISYPATVLATLLLFPAQPEFACVVVVVLAIGDGSAYVFGRTWGKTPLPWNPRKSWVGTLGFLFCSAPLAVLAYWLEATPVVPIWTAVACGTAAALAGAVAESLPTKLTDNLRVGVAAAIAVVCTHLALT